MLEMNFEIARHNMLEQQIRPWNVIDPVVLDALDCIPRENYVPIEFKESAFSDVELPIGHNQTMMSPKIEAKILQAVQVKKTDKILEIGTGSGYMTALLAHLAQQVYTIEIHESLSLAAQKVLMEEGFNNIDFFINDGTKGVTANTPYDVIILTGSVPELPDIYKKSLNKNGRLFAITGCAPVMEATLIKRVSANQFSTEVLFETELQALENMQCHKEFTL